MNSVTTRSRFWLACLALGVGLPARLTASAEPSGTAMFDSAPGAWLTVAPPESVTLAAGHGGVLTLAVSVPVGFHVQAHRTRKGLIPTQIIGLLPSGNLSFGEPVYPAGHPLEFGDGSGVMTVYEDRFTIALPVRASSLAGPGRYDFKAYLAFQSCDDAMCFPPRAVPFNFAVYVTR